MASSTSDESLFSVTKRTDIVQSESSDDMEAETSTDNRPAISTEPRKRKAPMPMPSDLDSDSEDSLDLTQDIDDVVVLTATKKSRKPTTPVAGTSRNAAAVRNRKSKGSEFITGLRALTVKQLVDLIENVIEKRPEMKNEFILLSPTPDLAPLENKLETLKKSIFKAFPWTKYGSERDSFCYRRVKGHLIAFQRECLQQSKSLIDSQQWKSTIDYTIIAWKFVGELPNWDDPKNNKHKEQCFKKLVMNFNNAFKKGTFAKQELESYIQKLHKLKQEHRKDNGVQNCITLAQSKLSNLQ